MQSSVMKMRSTATWLAALMVCASLLGVWLRPRDVEVANFLQKAVPIAFGEWSKLDESPLVIDPGTAETLRRVYKETLARTYSNKAGYRIMLSIARSANQIGVQEAHRPEICYPAQGFELIGNVKDGTLNTAFGSIEVRRLNTKMGARTEPITYWLTMADRVVRTQWDKRIVQFIAVVTGQAPGGLLFRVSSIDPNPDVAFAMQQQFVADMMATVSAEDRRKLSGLSPQL